MRLTKNTRLGKKPYKANNGYAAYDPTTFDPNKQISLNEQEFGVTPSSVQTSNTGVAPQGGQSALRLEGAKTTPDLSGQKIDFNKSSSGASAMSPKSFDYSGLATTGMAMGVGAIDKQQASLEAVGKAPSLSGEMGKGALKGAATVTPMALNPMMLAATGGLSALAVPAAAAIGAGVNYVTGSKKIKEFNTQMDAKKSLARQALTNRTNLSSQYNQADAVNRGYSSQGSNMSSFYGKNGGKLKFGNGGELVPNKKEMTRLPEHQEVAYQNWMKDNKYEESADYDYRGYWKEEGFKGLAKPNLSPMQKIKEVSSEVYPELDNFYKNNPNVAGMNHAPGEVSKNPYSKIPSKNLDYIIDLEKARDIMSNDVNAPKPKYRITRDQKNYFKSIKDNSSDTTDYADTPKKVQRETIASRLYVGDNMDNVAYTKKQDRYVGDLIKYANTRPNHLPDKFKRLAPFGEGDGYMQLSDESNKASEFDKRGQGTWVDDRFVAYKNGGKMRCDDGAIIRKDGGFLKSVSSDTKLAYGKTHEQGGILMSENAEIEGGGVTRDGKKLPGETVVDKGDHTLVVSDNLVNPKTGRTFAKDDLRLAKLARKYEGASTQLAKNSLKHIQAKREELHNLQQQMNGDASDQDTAQNGGKMRPINILTKPIKTGVPTRPAPMMAQNGGKIDKDAQLSADKRKYLELMSKDGRNQASTQERLAIKDYQKSLYERGVGSDFLFPFVDAGSQVVNGVRKVVNTLTDNHYQNGGKLRPINILTKPVKTTPRPATHFAKDGMKLYKDGGKYYDEYKAKGETDLGGGYKVKRGADGKVQYSKDNGKTYSRPDKATYDKLNSTAFKGKLGKYTDSNIPPKLDLSKIDNSDQPFRVGDTNPVAGNTIGTRVADNNKYSPTGSKITDVNDISYKESSNTQPSTLKGNSNNAGLKKAWDKTKEIGESALPGLSRAGKLASYAAPGLAQYYANKADIARQKGMKIPDAPQQGFVSLAKQNMEVDRAAVRKQQADYNAGVAGTLADSQTAALMKANMTSKAGDALVGVNQAERNANIETANRQTQLNLGIDAANKEGKYKQAYSQLEKDVDLSRRKAGNVAELSANLRDVQNTNRQEKYIDMDSAIKVAGLDERGQEYLTRQGANPKGYWMRRNGGKLTKLRR